MTKTNYGYCCINMDLREQKPSITTNRSMIKRTFTAKGPDYASELIVQNVKDLRTIIKWNEANGLKLYRMSSDIMPWMSEYNISDLKDFKTIKTILKDCGDLAKEYGKCKVNNSKGLWYRAIELVRVLHSPPSGLSLMR